MRRPIAAFLAAYMLWAPVAEARSAFVFNRSSYMNGTTTQGQAASKLQHNISQSVLTQFVNAFNPGSYDVFDDRQVQTTRAAAGYVNVNGTPTQYSQFVWVGNRMNYGAGQNVAESASDVSAGCYPCSLTITADTTYIPRVPHLFIGSGFNEADFTTVASARCSTGAKGESPDPGRQFTLAASRLKLEGTNLVWAEPLGARPQIPVTKRLGGGAPQQMITDKVAQASSFYEPMDGLRVVIGVHASNWVWYGDSLWATGILPAWRDSLYEWNGATGVNGDSLISSQKAVHVDWGSNNNPSASGVGYSTPWNWGAYMGYFPQKTSGLYLWAKYNDKWTTGNPVNTAVSPMIFDHWSTPAAIDNWSGAGTTTGQNTRMIGSPGILWMGVAMLDSASGGNVLGSSVRPRQVAIQVSGVCRRKNSLTAADAISPSDTVSFKASADSLDALGVPIIYGVCVDSMASYPSDLRYLKTKSNARFAVERWNGTTFSLHGADSALSANVGASRVDRVLMGSTNNWTTTEMRWRHQYANGLYSAPDSLALVTLTDADSIAWVIAVNGFRGVSQDAEADSAISGTSAPGTWTAMQREVPLRSLYSRKPAASILGLTFPGYNPRGGTQGNGRDRQQFVLNTSGENIFVDSMIVTHYVERSMWGMFMPYWFPPVVVQDRPFIFNTAAATFNGLNAQAFCEPYLTGTIGRNALLMTGTNLVRVTASSLGSGDGGTAAPNRPGWFQIKYFVNQCKAINRLGGRTLIAIVNPDQISLRDIRR